jgi:hypothetical protein
MWEPTRPTSGEGRRRWTYEGVRHPPRERHGPAVPPGYWRQHARRGDPRQHGKSQSERGSGPQPDAREGQAGPAGMADGFVVPMRPGNSGGGKGPEFRQGSGRGMRAGRVAMSLSPPINGSGTPGGVPRPAASPTLRGVRACPRAGCGRSARPVRRAGSGNGSMVGLVRHRQTKEPGTDRLDLNHRATPRPYRLDLTTGWLSPVK